MRAARRIVRDTQITVGMRTGDGWPERDGKRACGIRRQGRRAVIGLREIVADRYARRSDQ